MTRRNVERDDAILDLTGRYGIGLRIVYERLWFPGRNAGNAVQQLLKEGRLVARTGGLGGNRSYYQLSPSETAARGFPSSHANPPGSSRLNERLAALWFATMGKKPRPILSASDLREQFGRDLTHNTYCLQQKAKHGHVVLRLRLVGANMEPADAVRWLRETITEEERVQELADWLKNRLYGYALLVDDQSLKQTRVRAINNAIRNSGIRKKTIVEVKFSPSASSIGFAFQQYRASDNSK